ncbi:PIN domain-containing protein [Agromyces aerolatus]|uniref:PIN domain-containing protein n=1 Tax=Agromyces sp. LY-1074 TaxID=3074080 RepID=UPI002860DDE7|nr:MULTISPECIES: PIN domain-containing protein [unclassified Agromyces]MDR5700812.1 PIN domain-containing protein [Agromyces sp. LY-1074]MDR5707333.1 PIN domain-containing protein [Agromyces sp. LY-1358]
MARLILDTNALIQLDRHGGGAVGVSDFDDVAIAAITLAELRHGVLAADATRKPARERFVEDVEETIEVLPYTKPTAVEHAALLDHVRRTGTPRGAHDLIIAAHARQTGRRVVSLDLRARFGELPGVETVAGE